MKLGVDVIDGRPLYKYRVNLHTSRLAELNSIEMWELVLTNNKSRDDQIIQFLAPVAAARFASNYEDGVPSWEHCGEAVSNLRKRGIQRFSYLLERSLGLYRISPLRLQGGDTGWLETIISQAGLPAGMLKQGKVIRNILNEMMVSLADCGEDLGDVARDLVSRAVSENKLRTAYRDAGHLPALCEGLVRAVADLSAEAGWSGGELGSIWAITGWEDRLPFRVETAMAKEIVSQLLDVAAAATSGSMPKIERVMGKMGGEWQLRTCVVVPAGGIEIVDDSRDLLVIYYTVGGEPAGEACRLRRKCDSQYVVARAVQDFDGTVVDRPISLAVQGPAGYRSIDCEGGEPLEPESPWVFEPRSDGFLYKSLAPARLRSSELLVVVPEGAEATGDAVQIAGRLSLGGESRAFWKVAGKAQFNCNDAEPSTVEAGYQGPQVYLDFRGRPPNFKVNEFSTAFIGDPMPRRLGGLSGRVEWRKAGSPDWCHTPVRSMTGQMSFRLVGAEGEVFAERRRVFVFPENFRPETGGGKVAFVLPAEFSVVGSKPEPGGAYALQFGQSSRLQVCLSYPGGKVDVVFERRNPMSFVDVVTGEETCTGERRIAAREADRIQASSTLHDRIHVGREQDRWNAVHPIRLHNGSVSLSSMRDFFQALSFHPRGQTHALKVQFQNGPAIVIEASHQAVPCPVANVADVSGNSQAFLDAIAVANDEEREQVLVGFYQRIIGSPHEGRNSEQLDACLTWFGDFQNELGFLVPFLILAARPDLSLKTLFLARLRNKVEAEQGLLWALDEVPFFWHRVSGSVISESINWASRQFGPEVMSKFISYVVDLKSSTLPRLVMRKVALRPHADAWHSKVLNWGGRSTDELETRTPELAKIAAELRSQVNDQQIELELWSRPATIPTDVDIFRTRLFTPFELAVATARGVVLDERLMDDITYARYVIDKDLFDEAYAAGLVLVEDI